MTRQVASNASKVGVKLVPKGRVIESLRCLDFAVKMLIETAHPRVLLGRRPSSVIAMSERAWPRAAIRDFKSIMDLAPTSKGNGAGRPLP